jgi:hypothetical protein
MKSRLSLLLLTALCLTVGCTGLIATRATSKTINDDVYAMQARVAATQPVYALQENLCQFDFYAMTATVNPFAYMFDRRKTILCTSTIYGDLQTKSAQANEAYFRAKRGSASPAANVERLQDEAIWMRNIQRERDGK